MVSGYINHSVELKIAQVATPATLATVGARGQ